MNEALRTGTNWWSDATPGRFPTGMLSAAILTLMVFSAPAAFAASHDFQKEWAKLIAAAK